MVSFDQIYKQFIDCFDSKGYLELDRTYVLTNYYKDLLTLSKAKDYYMKNVVIGVSSVRLIYRQI